MSDILTRVRALIALADTEKTTPEEAEAAKAKAEALMFQYRIDRSKLSAEAKADGTDQEKPTHIKMDLCDSDLELASEFSSLANTIANHCGCKLVWIRRTSYDIVDVFGYKPDLEYFEMLYTTLLLHMSSVFFPKPDGSKSLGDNLLELRGLGMNWLQMAEVYGWRKTGYKTAKYEEWRHKDTGEIRTNWQLGGYYKRTTHAAAKERGVKLAVIPSAHSRQAATVSFRRSAALGYVARIYTRLERLRASRTGSGVVLASYIKAIDDLMSSTYPHLAENDEEKFEATHGAFTAGMHHANSADITGQGGRMPAGKEKMGVKS